MRLVGSDSGLEQVRVTDGGPIVERHKDGTFHVPEDVGKWLKTSGDFAQVGASLATMTAKSYPCPNCGRDNLLVESCGKCGWRAA